jgi:hypothetical protein
MTKKRTAKVQNVKKIPPSIISILAAILLVVLAYRLDYWTYGLRPSVSQREFWAGAHVVWMSLTYFAAPLMAGLLLTWLWFIQRHVQKHPILSLTYVVLGVMMPIYNLVMSAISMSLNSPSFVIYFPMAPLSLASFASGFITCFGLQRLIFRQSAI